MQNPLTRDFEHAKMRVVTPHHFFEEEDKVMFKKKIVSVLLALLLVSAMSVSAFAAADHGYNWMDGAASAPIRAAGEITQPENGGTDSHSAPYCGWFDEYWAEPQTGVFLFASVCGQSFSPLAPIGVVYTDIPLNLSGIASPVFSFLGGQHTAWLAGVNLTFLVDDGETFWLADTNTVRGSEGGYADVAGFQKPISVDLKKWADKNITLRILISDYEDNSGGLEGNNTKLNYVMLFGWKLLDGSTQVQDYSDWAAGIKNGFLSFESLTTLKPSVDEKNPATGEGNLALLSVVVFAVGAFSVMAFRKRAIS